MFPRQVESWRATCWRTTASRLPSRSCRVGSGTSRAASTRPFRYVVFWLDISFLLIPLFIIVLSSGRSVRKDVLVLCAINNTNYADKTRRANYSNFVVISRRDSKHNYSSRFPDFQPCSVANISNSPTFQINQFLSPCIKSQFRNSLYAMLKTSINFT